MHVMNDGSNSPLPANETLDKYQQPTRLEIVSRAYNEPIEKSVAPVRSGERRPAGVERAARQANLRQHGLDVLLGRRDQNAGLSDLGHVGDDEMRVGGLDIDALALDFGRKRSGEGCKETL